MIPASAIQLGSQGDGGIHTLSLNNSGGGGNTIVQYPGTEGQFFVPGLFHYICICIFNID